MNGHSTLRNVELRTGKVLQETNSIRKYFGEGITVLDQRTLKLTQQSHRGFVYDRGTFRLIPSSDYPGEGWGLASNGSQIFMSDGTAEIRVWNPTTLQEIRRFDAHDCQKRIESLNEREFIRGEIYANVWETDRIVRISPKDGHVTGWIDLSGLFPEADRAAGAYVLNGIAYDSLGDRLFVTGKLWPKLFEMQVIGKS